VLHKSNFLDQSLLIGSVERRIKLAELQNYAAETPYINSIIVLTPLEHLWGLVGQGTHILDQFQSSNLSCDSKISNLNGVIPTLQEYVAWLDVSVGYALGVQVLNRQQYLYDESLDASLR